MVPRPAGPREAAERGHEAVAVSAERDQVIGRRCVRGRVLEGPVVRFDGGLLAAPLADAARAGEGFVPGAQVDGVAVVEPLRVR